MLSLCSLIALSCSPCAPSCSLSAPRCSLVALPCSPFSHFLFSFSPSISCKFQRDPLCSWKWILIRWFHIWLCRPPTYAPLLFLFCPFYLRCYGIFTIYLASVISCHFVRSDTCCDLACLFYQSPSNSEKEKDYCTVSSTIQKYIAWSL